MLLLAIIIILMITFFIKSISTFKKAKKEDCDEDKLREINKKASRYMIISVILVPVFIFLSFKIIIEYFLF